MAEVFLLMWQPFNKPKELDPEELLPFCTRCFQIGAVCDEENEHNNFCHMCGASGACIPVKRKYARNLSDRIYEDMKSWRDSGFEQGTDLQRGDLVLVDDKPIRVSKVNRSVLNWEVVDDDGNIYDYTKIKAFTRQLNGQNNYNRP
jgi:hypothetical protein